MRPIYQAVCFSSIEYSAAFSLTLQQHGNWIMPCPHQGLSDARTWDRCAGVSSQDTGLEMLPEIAGRYNNRIENGICISHYLADE